MEYPLNCYIGVCSDDSNVLLDLAEQEKWEELVVALETNSRLVNKSRNMQRPIENKGGEEGVFNCLSLKYLGKYIFQTDVDQCFPYTGTNFFFKGLSLIHLLPVSCLYFHF